MAYIGTSKFADYVLLCRLEDVFTRQGFEISRATRSVWCRDVADLVEFLYQRSVRQPHVVATDTTVLPMLSVGKTQPARLWVCIGGTVPTGLRAARRVLPWRGIAFTIEG